MLRFILVLSIAAISGCANSSKAEGLAREWVKRYHPAATIVVGPNCEWSDSDKNGRVRCNLTLQEDGGTTNPPIECPSDWLPQPFTTECQLSKGGW